MKTYVVILTANQQLPLNVVGRFVKLLSATGAVTVRAESRKGNRVLSDGLEMEVGDKPIFPENFDLLRVTDTSGAPNTVELLVGEGDHESNAVVGSVSITNTAATTLDSAADQAIANGASHDIAANAARRELILEADAGNSGDLLVRDQSAVTSEGIRLKPGERLFLSFKGALRVRNNSGAAQNLYIVELTG